MVISYNPLWKLLIDRQMKRTDLKEKSGVSSNVIAKMGKNQYVSLESIAKICTALECEIGDVIEFSRGHI